MTYSETPENGGRTVEQAATERAGTGTWDQDARGQHEQLQAEQAAANENAAPVEPGADYQPRDPETEQRADQGSETVARDRATHGDPTLAQAADTPGDVQGLTPDDYSGPDGPAVDAAGTERRDAFEDGRPVDGEGVTR